MTETLSALEPPVPRPAANLQDALQIVKDWENGLINNLSPDGVAVALYLQRARVGQQITTAFQVAELGQVAIV